MYMSDLFSSFQRLGLKPLNHQLLRTVMIVSFLFLTCSCQSWLQPTLQQDIVEIQAGEYKLDKDHAVLLFKINHMGFSSYVGRFNEFDVSLDFDPNNIENSRIEAIIDMRSIDVNNPEFATKLGGTAWLDSQRFPQAVFRSLAVKKTDSLKAFHLSVL